MHGESPESCIRYAISGVVVPALDRCLEETIPAELQGIGETEHSGPRRLALPMNYRVLPSAECAKLLRRREQ